MTRAYPISTASGTGTRVVTRTGSRIAHAWRGYWQRRAQRATIHLLDSLDDRTLHDIGIGRSEITSAVYGRRGDRARCYEESWRLWQAGR